jgi:hypothetical protein
VHRVQELETHGPLGQDPHQEVESHDPFGQNHPHVDQEVEPHDPLDQDPLHVDQVVEAQDPFGQDPLNVAQEVGLLDLVAGSLAISTTMEMPQKKNLGLWKQRPQDSRK